MTTYDTSYVSVAASQTGATVGAREGEVVSRVIIVPESTSPGAVTLLDGAVSITIFAGGASSVLDLKPWTVDIELRSVDGAWTVTTGANVHVIVAGAF